MTVDGSGRLGPHDRVVLQALAPVGRPVQLDPAACWVAAGPDDHAIVLAGPRDASGFWFDPNTRWALVDLDSGRVVHEGDLENSGNHVDFSPDGRHAAIAGRDGRLLVLDLLAGEPLRPPVPGHSDIIRSVTYSLDGRRILTSAEDSTIGLWDGDTGLLVARLPVPQRAMIAAFRGDEDAVLSVDTGMGPVYEWNTDLERAVDFACRVAGRDFTEAEWAAQFGTRAYRETCPAP
jgi:hypothetical protein